MVLTCSDLHVIRPYERALVAPHRYFLETGAADTAVFVPFSMAKHGGLCCQSVEIVDMIGTLTNLGQINSIVLCGGYKARGCGLTEAQAAYNRLLNDSIPVKYEHLSKNTYQNALHARPLLRELRSQKVVLCVNALQSGRTLGTFQHLMPDIEFLVAPVLATIWRDNAKITLRNRLVFAVREHVATAIFRQKGWM